MNNKLSEKFLENMKKKRKGEATARTTEQCEKIQSTIMKNRSL